MTVGKVLKYIAVTAVFLAIGLLLLRIVLLNRYPADAEGIFKTDAIADAAELSAVTWEPPVPYDNSNFCNFFSHQPIYVENGGVFFITLRYNRSLSETVAEKFGYDGEIENLPLTVSLHINEAVCRPARVVSCQAYGLYCYRRYAFEGVDTVGAEALQLQVRYGEAASLTEEPFSQLELYLAGQPTKPYTLTKTDKNRLK